LERGCVHSTSRSTPEHTVAMLGRCGWSGGHSRAPVVLAIFAPLN